MKRAVSTLVLLLLVALMATSVSFVHTAVSPIASPVTLLWTNPMEVFDVKVAGDGAHLAAVNSSPSGLYFFSYDNSTPVWWWLDTADVPLSVAISFDGNQVAVGTSTGFVHYFDGCLLRSGVQGSETWRSIDLGGAIERRTIDMSDDGQIVVVGGTGDAVYYFAGCRARSGSTEATTWLDYPTQCLEIFAVDLSPDGQFIAVGGSKFAPGGGFVAYYMQASTPPFPKNEVWNARSSIAEPISDIKVSDDGYSVAAVSGLIVATLHYWRNSAGLAGDPLDTWNNTLPYACVDTSADGNEVVAGKPLPAICGIHFWANARSLTGINVSESWSRHEGELVPDVAINKAGTVLAAVAARFNAGTEYFAYFYRADGVSMGEFQLDSASDKVSMSNSGETVVVGGAVIDSLYVFIIQVPETVGGTIVFGDLQVIAPLLICSAAVAVGLVALIGMRKKL